MGNIKLTVWGREFDLEVVFDCYSGEKATLSQEQAFNSFIQNKSLIDASLENVFEYCK